MVVVDLEVAEDKAHHANNLVKEANERLLDVFLVSREHKYPVVIGFEMYQRYSDVFVFDIVKTYNNEPVGSIALRVHEDSTSLYLEHILILDKFRGNDYNRLVLDELKEFWDFIYGNSDEDAISYWEHIGADFIEGNYFVY